MDDYDKLDCEPLYLERGGSVLRLPFVIGPHDYQRREESVLRRVRAGRDRMPIGSGNLLASHVLARDVGTAAVAALGVAAEVFVLSEHPVLAYRFEGTRFDCGSKLGLVRATLHMALNDEQIGAATRELINDAAKR
jgi:hypothetical protein